MEQGKSAKRWERTQTTNLWKLASTDGYYARVKVNGREKWKSLKTKLSSVAKLRLADFERTERSRANKPVSQSPIADNTAGAFLDLFLIDVRAHEKAKSSTERTENAALALEKTWPGFRSLNIRNITASMCAEWAANARAKGTGFVAPRAKRVHRPMSASAFNKTLAVLRSTLAIAVKAGALYENPADEITRMPPKKKDLILPSKDKFAKILKHIRDAKQRASQQSADMVSFLAFTGARIGECRVATWGDIDTGRNLMRIHGTKTVSSDRWIPLFPNLSALLGAIRTRRFSCESNERIFSNDSCDNSLSAACLAVGVKSMSHHDLRHLFATWCIESGVDIPTVSRWLGHADGGALAMKTYGHLRQEHSQEQAKKVTW